MAGGGSKPGERRGGRKPGTPNKASAARQAEVAASGITPLEVMLKNMRLADKNADDLQKALDEQPEIGLDVRVHLMGEIARQRQVAQNCAKDAANYVHPKLANIQHGSDPNNPLNFVTDEDRKAVILAYLAANPELRKQLN